MLRPYGELKAPQTDGEILETVKPINCEYLGRPEIGLSETGESYSENHESHGLAKGMGPRYHFQ